MLMEMETWTISASTPPHSFEFFHSIELTVADVVLLYWVGWCKNWDCGLLVSIILVGT